MLNVGGLMKRSGFSLGLMILVAAAQAVASPTGFQATGTDPAPWAKIFGAVGIGGAGTKDPKIVVLGSNSQLNASAIAENHILILEGYSPAAQAAGFKVRPETISVRQIVDSHAPNMQIVWQEPLSLTTVDVPEGFEVYARERWKQIPVLAGKKTSHGAILWMASSPGDTGMERYPYLLQALADLGLPLPAQANNLWAFFDSSYRIRADVDYLAKRWRESGISVLHVAAWHDFEPNPVNDEYVTKLIQACHRNAILVYAWLELPHVSEKFWQDHPEWREKTALGQDAELDWRKLMNLQNPACKQAVAAQVTQLLKEFDWDGVNVAELYFESLEGASNPARFTPMNDDVRQNFQRAKGWDPKTLFDPSSPNYASKSPHKLRDFLNYRADLAAKMQAEWLQVVDGARAAKPYLDVALTHIDDRFEPGIRDALGADVARSLPLIKARQSTLLVEDPATIWNLGPERYSKLAQKYEELTKDKSQIAVDINVVDRYQDVYPTKKQTGVEFLQLVHEAANSFSKVALYVENSLEKQDLTLLPSAASTATVEQTSADELQVNGRETTRVDWQGSAEIDGKPWPIQNARSVLVPAGKHRLSTGFSQVPVTISDFNGDVRTAQVEPGRVDIAYSSRSRAIVVLGSDVSGVEVDEAIYPIAGAANTSFLLPAGQHIVTFRR